jgi:hypothetical protein
MLLFFANILFPLLSCDVSIFCPFCPFYVNNASNPKPINPLQKQSQNRFNGPQDGLKFLELKIVSPGK